MLKQIKSIIEDELIDDEAFLHYFQEYVKLMQDHCINLEIIRFHNSITIQLLDELISFDTRNGL